MTALRDMSTRRLKRRFVRYLRLYWKSDMNMYFEYAKTVRSILTERKVYIP